MHELDRPGSYPTTPAPTREVTLGDIIAGFYNRRWIVAALIVIGLVAGIVKTVVTKPLWESTSQIVLLQRDPRLAPPSQTAYAIPPVESVETQLSLIQSDAMAERVSDYMKQNASLNGRSTDDAGISTNDFRRFVSVANQKDSNVLVISARGRTPDQAMSLANAVAQAFVQWKDELARRDAGSAEGSLQTRSQRAHDAVDQAESQLAAFEHANGVVDVRQQTSDLLTRLAQRETDVGSMQSDYDSAAARYADLSTKLKTMDTAISKSSGVRDDSLILSLQTQLNALEMQRVQQSQTVTPAFPGTLPTLDAQIADIKTRLATAIKGVGQDAPTLQSQGNLLDLYRQAEIDMRFAEARLKATETVRDNLIKQSQQLPKIGLEFARLQRSVDVASTVYSGILGALEAARSDRDMTTGNVQVAQAGTTPDAPVEPKPILNVLIGLIAGAMLATVAVAALEGGVRRVYTLNQMITMVSGPVIGVLPQWTRTQQKAIAQGAGASPKSWRSALPVRDAYGRTSARLALACGQIAGTKSGSVIMVTSATAGEGVSTVSSQMAHQLALSGHTVILVDANFRKPSQHLRYGGDPNQGLIALLRDGEGADRTIQGTGLPKLQVVVAGDFTINDEALVGTEKMGNFLDYARTHSDFVIIDTQSCDTPVPILLSRLVDRIVQVVGLGKTSERALQETQEALSAVGKPVVTIVNRATPLAGTLPPIPQSYPTPERPRLAEARAEKLLQSPDDGNGRAPGEAVR